MTLSFLLPDNAVAVDIRTFVLYDAVDVLSVGDNLSPVEIMLGSQAIDRQG
jgi:hypothetical protein